jgi:hypothetical protein
VPRGKARNRAQGGRPERYGSHPAASAAPTAGAIAANLGFVVVVERLALEA